MSFMSVMKHIGHVLKVGFGIALPIAETFGRSAVSVFLPGMAPIFNATVAAVSLAEQKYVALGQEKAGTKKMQDVLSLMEPVIAQALHDAGLDNTTASVQKYIESVVTILNTTPAPALPPQPTQQP